jgi:hypothetical protein
LKQKTELRKIALSLAIIIKLCTKVMKEHNSQPTITSLKSEAKSLIVIAFKKHTNWATSCELNDFDEMPHPVGEDA